jgi:aminoglycoside phosphotransferase (APT) family kinase protein
VPKWLYQSGEAKLPDPDTSFAGHLMPGCSTNLDRSVPRPLGVDATTALRLLTDAGVHPGSLGIRRIPSGNAVYRLKAESDTYFLKVPTKDLEFWPDPLEGAAVKVERELAASRCLANHGVPGLEVVWAEPGSANPLGRPYLLTRSAPGRPFTQIVPARARRGWRSPLRAVGRFLASVHRIEFDTAGYLVSPEGPIGPTLPAPVRPEHRAEVAQAHALADLDQASSRLDSRTIEALEARLGSLAETIGPDFLQPRFVIGGFHPNHPFLALLEGEWSVRGCIDLELASGGRPLDDLVTFGVGMMFRSDPAIPWWEPLFEGYGSEPSFEGVRTELLGSGAYLFGLSGDLGIIYRALLDADSWHELFNAHRSTTTTANPGRMDPLPVANPTRPSQG